jgi:hypothetical protein
MNRRDGSAWFLVLRSGGYDLRRLPPPANTIPVVAISGGQAPAAPPASQHPLLNATSDQPISVRGYGLGPRQWRVLPGGALGADGGTATLMIGNIDPISRLSIVGLAGTGSAGTWRGASLSAGLRRWAVGLEGAVWKVDHEPSKSAEALALPAGDIRSAGAGAVARIASEGSQTAYVVRGGFTSGQVSNASRSTARHVALGEARGRVSLSLGPASTSILGGISGTIGQTGGESWQRIIANATVTLGTNRHWLRGDVSRGEVTRAEAGETGRASEQFVVGGNANPFINPLYFTQRVALPAVPAGFVQGRRFEKIRASLGGFAWEPYLLWIAGGESLERYRRIAGLERSFEITALGFVRLPAVRLRGGAAWSFDEPFRDRPRAWLSVNYSP